MNWNEAKKQTFGVEIEMAEISAAQAARVAAEYFGSGMYNSSAAFDCEGRQWKFVYDGSIRGMGCECVTPPLTYDEDIELLLGLIKAFRKEGAKSDPSYGCGVHIHIAGKGNHDGKSLRNLMNLMASHEELLRMAVGIEDSRLERYCRKVHRPFLDAINKKRPETIEEVQKLWYSTNGEHFPSGDPNAGRNHYYDSRYRMLNFHSLYRTGTIEFRLFQFDKATEEKKNGLHGGMLRAYVQLCLVMSQTAKESRSISNKPVQLENTKFAMRTWMNRMGMIGEEFKTAHLIFRRKLEGNAGFRYGNR